MSEQYVFSHYEVDGVLTPQNPLGITTTMDTVIKARYIPLVSYMSYVVENPTTTAKVITIVSSKDVTVPAQGSTTITLQPGDKIVLK